jgi:hypothetical protein
MIYYEKGSTNTVLGEEDLKQGLYEALEKLGPRKKVLAVPPDITRYHSKAGLLTEYAWEYYGERPQRCICRPWGPMLP